MADFNTHITTSSLLGAGIGGCAYFFAGFPFDQCLLGAGLCSLAGMLPDLDSPNSVPVRETVGLSAAIIPMLLLERFRQLGLSTEQVVIAAAIIYFGIRFGVAEIFRRYTKHRGMWHSVPAALIASFLALLICTCEVIEFRLFKGLMVFCGFISHLILDELYSIDLAGKRVKRSQGTALKFFSRNSYANFSCYFKLAIVVLFLSFDGMLMNAIGLNPTPVPTVAKNWFERYVGPLDDDRFQHKDYIYWKDWPTFDNAHDHEHHSDNPHRFNPRIFLPRSRNRIPASSTSTPIGSNDSDEIKINASDWKYLSGQSEPDDEDDFNDMNDNQNGKKVFEW